MKIENKNRENKKMLLPLRLQFFAEGGNTTNGEDETEGQEVPGGNADKPHQNINAPTKTFDEVLTDKTFQAEFDRRIQKALTTQRDKLEVLFNEKATEAEKLSIMTKEEKAEYLSQKREKDLARREEEILRKELVADARNKLAQKGLPIRLADFLTYTSDNECNNSIEKMEKIFSDSVDELVKERLKGGKPPKAAPTQDTVVTPEEFKKMGYAERLKFKTEHPEEYNRLKEK